MFELIIIGGGPAGIAAGIYAARKKIKTLLIADAFGGQSIVSPMIENWIGQETISGFDLAKSLEKHLRKYEKLGDIEIWTGDKVNQIQSQKGGFIVSTEKNKNTETKTVLLCSGSRRRRLGVPGEDEFDGKGVAWCGTCDAPLFQGKDVVVIGGGNAGLESVLTLAPYAKNLYLLQRSGQLKGDPVTQEKIKRLKKLTIIYNAVTQEILGDQMVTGLRYKNTETNEEKILEVGGVFIEIGSVPNSDFVKDLVEIDQWGQIKVDCATQQSSRKGIWVAGDVGDVLYKQNNISAGDAIKAVLNIFDYLQK